MFLSTAILFPVLLPFSLAAAVGKLQERDGSSCSDVHVFMARGNGEAYPGRVGAIANTVCSGLPSCDSENILFVATESYCDQASDGVASGLSQVAAYASRCPHSKLVLAGYSLGAQIVGDILAGGGGSFYGCVERSNTGLSAGSSPGSQIAVVLLFGDVRHVANQPYNVGTGSGDEGQYPRSGSDLSNLNQFSGKIQSYCLSTDPICAGGDDGESHTTYMDVYANTAGEWAQQVLGLGGAASSSVFVASSTPTPTSTTTPTLTPTSTSVPASSTSSSSSLASAAPTSTSPSSSLTSAAPTTSAPISSSTSVQGTSTSSVEDTTSTSSTQQSSSSSSLTPFVFSNTASVATTSTFSNSATSTFSTKSTSTSSPTTTATSTHSQPPASTVATSSSKAGAYSNSAQLTLNLVTLVVIKALAF